MERQYRFEYCDANAPKLTDDINQLFPGWAGEEEALLVMSPHDDDAIIGAGYAITAAMQAGARVYIVIVCRGDGGYSALEAKDTIEAVREQETLACYRQLGIAAENIHRMGYADFSALAYIGWDLPGGQAGEMRTLLRYLRDRKITRVMVPNHYREHVDHLAAYLMGSFEAPQAGDAMKVDYGTPHPVKSVLEYSVWANLDPEDALVCGRGTSLRANRILVAEAAVEERIAECIREYRSQSKIIENLVASRAERRTPKGRYVEVYIAFDPRPKMDFAPYTALVGGLEG